MAEERTRLGRGLAALMGDVGEESASTEKPRGQRRVPIEFLRANPRNPRRSFADAEIEELAGSIRERGIIQPIVARAVRGQPDQFEIIAGERRWRAAQRAGLHDVPVVVIEASDAQALEFAIIENVQRSDLNAVEEAMGYQALIEEYKHSQDDVAKIVGKSRSHVANTLRLLKLSAPIKSYIQTGKLTAGHARTLIGQPNAEEIADEIVKSGLNVRQVEAMARKSGKDQGKDQGKAAKGKLTGKDADTRALEKRLSDVLGLIVSVDHRGGKSGGVMHIKYSDLEQLDAIIRKLDRR